MSMRPIIIVNVRQIINSGVGIEHLVRVTDFFLHYVITKSMVPGRIENWTAIFDMRDVGVTELPSKHI
jgi:CRAL/TRIO domain